MANKKQQETQKKNHDRLVERQLKKRMDGKKNQGGKNTQKKRVAFLPKGLFQGSEKPGRKEKQPQKTKLRQNLQIEIVRANRTFVI